MGRSKRKAKKNTATATISDLPNPVMCDILSRLPLDSIIASKRVCKIWHKLILEPHFAKLYLSRFPLSLVFFRHDSVSKSPSYVEILQLHDPPDLDQHNATTMRLRSEIDFPHRLVQMVASCNGSILLKNYVWKDDLVIIVCNPLRGHHLILPVPPRLALRTLHFAGLGFVHSSSTDKYKVFIFLEDNPHNPARLYCDTFTIGIDDEWRSIGDTGKPPADFPSPVVFLNGAFHWIGLENSWVICYFDIEKEQFGSFPLPSHFEQGHICLGVVDNWLYIHQEYPYRVWNFWVMKNYGDFGSWTLEWVIERPITREFSRLVKLLKMLKDGTLLIILEKFTLGSKRSPPKITMNLASYNRRTRVLKTMEYSGMPSLGDSLIDALIDAPFFFSPMDALQ